MDTQLYAEVPGVPTGLPEGQQNDLRHKTIAGMLTVGAIFAWQGFVKKAEWRKWSVPIVNIGAGEGPYNIDIDRESFVDRAVETARARGCRRVLLVQHEEHLHYYVDHFRQRCEALGLKSGDMPADMPSMSLDYEPYGYELFTRIWASRPRPDAVVIPDDVIAKGVSQAALGLQVQTLRDIEIIAMVNRGAPIFYPAPITAIEVDLEKIAATAGRMLIDLINGKRVPHKSLHTL